MRIEYFGITLIFLLSGYFWGKLINHFFPTLKSISTTALGLIIPIALFQIIVFIGVPNNWNTIIYQIGLIISLLISPLLCICFKANVVPHKNDWFALLLGVVCTVIIVCISSTMNTNNVFFDSTFYLSRVIDSSTANIMGYIDSYSGMPTNHIFAIYDYQGFYYLWGIVLRFYAQMFGALESLTPIYIWGATLCYGLLLGETVAMCVQLLFTDRTKKNILIVALVILFLAPYYVNYFNTTLAFFGNTYRTVIVGLALLLCFCYLKERNNGYLILLGLVYLAGIGVSSSCFFIFAFLSTGLFLASILQKKQEKFFVPCFLGINLPLVLNFFYLGTDWATGIYLPQTKSICILYLVAFGLSWFWDLIPDKIRKIGKILVIAAYPVLFIGLVFLSFKLKDGAYGYAFFFDTRSLNDMTLNYVSWVGRYELVRNIILWIFTIVSFINIKKNTSFKIMLLVVVVLFANPLVEPFIATYATQIAYCRVFEIFVNPFVLCFFLKEFMELIKPKMLALASLTIASCLNGIIAVRTVLVPFSMLLVRNQEGYNWETKVTKDQWDMYTYIIDNIVTNNQERPLILTQDISLKAYVPNVQMYFSSVDVRKASGNEVFDSTTNISKAIILLNPLAIDANGDFNGITPDYTQLPEVIKDSQAEYVLIRIPMAVYDPRGWYVEAYKFAEDIVEEVYHNDTWMLLKVTK